MPLPLGAPFREEHLMKPIKTIRAFIPALALALARALLASFTDPLFLLEVLLLLNFVPLLER